MVKPEDYFPFLRPAVEARIGKLPDPLYLLLLENVVQQCSASEEHSVNSIIAYWEEHGPGRAK